MYLNVYEWPEDSLQHCNWTSQSWWYTGILIIKIYLFYHTLHHECHTPRFCFQGPCTAIKCFRVIVELVISPQFASLHLSGECCRTLTLISQKSLFTQLLELPLITSCSYSASLQGWYIFGQLSPGPISKLNEVTRHVRKGTIGQQFPQMLILLQHLIVN